MRQVLEGQVSAGNATIHPGLTRITALIGEPFQAWLHLAERRQLRRLRLWEPGGVTHPTSTIRERLENDMNVTIIGQELVSLSNADRSDAVVENYYADNIVSIEPAGGADGTFDGIAAVREKHVFWNEQHEIHSAIAEGPYVGPRDDQFLVKFSLDVTPRGAARMQFQEMGLYTVADDKIVREEFSALQA